jgi:hypothetical protein
MFRKQVKEINNDLKHTRKAIIALGCSFVQGQGAVNDELYQDYKWDMVEIGKKLEIQLTSKEKAELLNKYSNLSVHSTVIDFTLMEYENAFVNKLCKKYFQGEYTPINFGLSGCGNRATIKELYFYPDINWDIIDEIVVIYCPSGVERFDFMHDVYEDHFHWKAMWPNWEGQSDPERQALWRGYSKTIWSEKFGALEQIAHVQELLTWCKLKNAKLVITPGFDRRYEKPYFKNSLETTIDRDIDGNIQTEKNPIFFKPDIDYLLDLFPWDKIFKPEGFQTFADLAMSKEPLIESNDYFFQFLNKGSPNMWITPCSHPSAKAHDLFAKSLFEKLKGDY